MSHSSRHSGQYKTEGTGATDIRTMLRPLFRNPVASRSPSVSHTCLESLSGRCAPSDVASMNPDLWIFSQPAVLV
ncbi:hypothetical protein ACFH04_06925 [Streptomyces noboritoensis]|uniref:Uncharacterized protein n=1 Tax=Streptomyces noboritoensis TaxID=67337 RepID=A0ABV6TCD4_9ACTN